MTITSKVVALQDEKEVLTLVDTGGNSKYTKNTLSGMSQCDVGVLVVSANKHDFAFQYKRIKELLGCAFTLGLRDIIVVVNHLSYFANEKENRYNEVV